MALSNSQLVLQICRWEYNTRIFSKAFGSPKLACFSLSLIQIISSNLRNYYIKETMEVQKQMETPFNDVLVILEYGIVAVGALLVVTSFMRLGCPFTEMIYAEAARKQKKSK
ncbi:PEMT [Bugula neritina]|uniref:PEMT n=1 Tax=Bugula neritina TaxID=10212 RepID=A0A7J7JKL0_BUGNE|nr:PEMT [Bugula neritina]